MADASAALGIIGRRGLSKVRHIDVQHLWVQRAAASKSLEYRKQEGSKNPADICTKSVEAWRLRVHMDYVGVVSVGGRADSAPALVI